MSSPRVTPRDLRPGDRVLVVDDGAQYLPARQARGAQTATVVSVELSGERRGARSVREYRVRLVVPCRVVLLAGEDEPLLRGHREERR